MSHLLQFENDYKDKLEKEFSARKEFEKEQLIQFSMGIKWPGCKRWYRPTESNGHGKVHTFAALKSKENYVKQMVLKVAMKLSGKLMREAANYHIKHEIIKKLQNRGQQERLVQFMFQSSKREI
ncbi:hypothetical protein ZOSMA_3G00770 [Zostera marina]|uniref:Uncharacterized protein n=1 Tax=Zostera marina TaxID=29655 RepID=A0A0K9P3L3_ZOSMR|nr:hypothetical protein ZOSMA_3G00770 [Zostera marina]